MSASEAMAALKFPKLIYTEESVAGKWRADSVRYADLMTIFVR